MARTLVLAGALALVALFAFLTLSVALRDGVTFLVVLAFLILLVLTIGVLGALTSSDDE